MTATINRTSKAVAEWCNIFRAQGTESYTSSVTFMKQLTVVAISTITYMKNAFPEDNYTDSPLGSLQLKILKKKCDDEVAQFLSTSILQAFDALEKKYLHKLVLSFYEEDCVIENLLEYYVFEYIYTSDGVSMNIHSKSRGGDKKLKCTFEDVERQTTMLIKSLIVVMQSCQELPKASNISIRLYYNDEAPEGYHAPGYQSCTKAHHLEYTRSQALRLGHVATEHHTLVARAYVRDAAGPNSGEAIASQNSPETPSTQQFDGTFSDSEKVKNRIICPCNKYDEGEPYNPAIITCSHCKSRQHAACFGIHSFNVNAVKEHCCTNCADLGKPGLEQNLLAKLGARKRECMAIFRRTLQVCRECSEVGGAILAQRFNMSSVNAVKLMQLLQKCDIVTCSDDDDLMSPKKIHPDQLHATISNYFHNIEETLADRLIAETFSQESIPEDPIENVLTPMEKVSLQNASTIGRVIPNTDVQMSAVSDDLTLKQYREVMLSTKVYDLEELPLGGAHNPVTDVEKVVKENEAKRLAKRKMEDKGRLRNSVKKAKLH